MPAASGPRYIGAYGGNGSISARYDYIRFTPDPPVDSAAPSTSHTLAPARRTARPAGTARRSSVTLAAGDEGECVSGVDAHRVPGRRRRVRALQRAVQRRGDGTHTVEYRSIDKAGNAEAAKSVTVKLDATAPATTPAVARTGTGPGRR